jgi:hypothetical protein
MPFVSFAEKYSFNLSDCLARNFTVEYCGEIEQKILNCIEKQPVEFCVEAKYKNAQYFLELPEIIRNATLRYRSLNDSEKAKVAESLLKLNAELGLYQDSLTPISFFSVDFSFNESPAVNRTVKLLFNATSEFNDYKNVTVHLTLPENFELVIGSLERSVVDVKNGESFQLEFLLKAVEEGSGTISVTVNAFTVKNALINQRFPLHTYASKTPITTSPVQKEPSIKNKYLLISAFIVIVFLFFLLLMIRRQSK